MPTNTAGRQREIENKRTRIYTSLAAYLASSLHKPQPFVPNYAVEERSVWLYYHRRSSHTRRCYWHVRTCVRPSVRPAVTFPCLDSKTIGWMELNISATPVYDRSYSWLLMWMLCNCTTGHTRDFYVNVMPVYYMLTPRKNKYSLTFIDHFTRYAEAFTIPDQTAETSARIYATQIARRHGTVRT